MTHMSNYGNDRLGLYTFESVIKFIQCWTNLKLSSAPPLQLAESYFKLYPGEADPVWGVSGVIFCVFFNYFCLFLRILATIQGIEESGRETNPAIPYRNF